MESSNECNMYQSPTKLTYMIMYLNKILQKFLRFTQKPANKVFGLGV